MEFNAGHSVRLSNLPEPLDPEQSLCLTRSNRDSKALKASTQAPSPVVVVQIQFLCALVHNTMEASCVSQANTNPLFINSYLMNVLV